MNLIAGKKKTNSEGEKKVYCAKETIMTDHENFTC